MSVFPTTVPSKTLAQNLSSSGTTLYLNNTLSWDGVQLSSSDFGTQLFAVLRNPSNTQLELIELDPATVTSSNAITILKRGLPYNGDTTADTETKYNWSGSETICELGSDTPQLLKQMVDSAGDETIAGVKTFSSSPIAPTPTTATQVAIKSYVDGVAIAGVADSDDTTKGAVEQATMAEIEAGSASGGTTAPIVIKASRLGARLYTAYAADAGANDTYAITCAPVPTAYTAGMVITFKANTVNTGACTVNVNSLGAKSLKVHKDLDPQDGYIKAGQIVTAIYDGTNFQIQSVSGKPSLSQSGYEIYAADAGANDTYAVTLAPAPTAYADGMVVNFKANTVNTGAATLNVNAIGAISILRPDGSALADADIAANQVVQVVYRGGSFYLLSPVANSPIYKNGTTTKDASDASTTQNIAHGLGRAPRKVTITAICKSATGAAADQGFAFAKTVYNGTTQSSQSNYTNSAVPAYVNASTFSLNSAAAIGDQTGVVTVDATNIIITWTKTSSPAGTFYLLWEAEA